MRHRLTAPEPHGHLFHVEAVLERPGAAPELHFPVWTPGSYLVREFARHVEGLEATDGAARALRVERLDKHRLRVHAEGGEALPRRGGVRLSTPSSVAQVSAFTAASAEANPIQIHGSCGRKKFSPAKTVAKAPLPNTWPASREPPLA